MSTMKPYFHLLTLIYIILIANICTGRNKIGDGGKFPLISMINHVEFLDSTANNPLAGCSFLLETEKGIFAITCKHSLWVTKSKEMKGVHFEGTLKEWRMHRKDDSTKYVITDKLLNEDRIELIGEDVVHSDYLVFSIKENKSDVVPIKSRQTELKQGELLYMIGWSFKDKSGPQRIYKAKYLKSITNHILIENEDNSNLAGMSGAPVVDADGKLVGIVSGFTQDETTQKWYNSPCSTDYLKKIIEP